MPLAGGLRFPSRPIRLIVPFPAGGNSDGITRIVAQRLSEYESKTSLLAGYYKQGGIVKAINGVGTVDEVEQRIGDALK